MICPVCGKKFSFFKLGVYCSSECEKAAEKEFEELLRSMEQEENEIEELSKEHNIDGSG